MSLRVAFVSLHTSPLERAGTADAGGMNVLILALARALARRGVHVDFVTRRTSPAQAEVEEIEPGVRLRRLAAGPAAPLPKSEIDAHIEDFQRHLAELQPYDLYHSHHWMSGVAALPVARAAGAPHVTTFHSVAAHPNAPLRDGEPAESPARLDGEIVCARESDLVIAVSHYEAAVVIGRLGADPSRVSIVRPGVDVELFHPAGSEEAGWAPAGVRPGYALFAARLQPLKGPDLALRALAEVPANVRPDLVLVGEASPDFAGYEAELHALAEDLGIADAVTFLPGQDRASLAQLLRHASVVLVPSHSETFGLIALEASASGVPVLASAAGGLTEAICNTHTGLLIPSRDPAAWGEALTALLSDSAAHAAMAATARERAESMSWDAVADDTLAHYRRLIQEG
ncbi:MAG: glycosyltransferase [Dermabacter sp.]|nr:glycosyltransferase [Dermabacter sp.]